MSETSDRVESIFHAAVLLAGLAERADYLKQACAGDDSLRKQVEMLLRANDRAEHLLDKPALPAPGALEPTMAVVPGEQPGTVIAGRYKLLEAIGEGGMGTVWVAEQSEPVRRKVALKLIKAGMDSRSVLARFEAERQALAVMDHPNIAKVLDGGLTDAGRPYFVMEYVKGVPITDYCDAARLNVPERLKLFAQVCQAVQHAHQKGIIHRDLKPSNILVAPYDDRPIPKVIDFGLAKAMHQSLTERTVHTAHETVLGTPLYMSPEQAQLNNLDVDTRSDIYSLGVLLYELLTGSTPLEKQRFKEAAWDEVKRIIREEEPVRPSTRLSSANALPSLAAGRQTEPARLTKLVRGELDWIVMKALEKDRSRRYETANGFAADVQRYLAGEPVHAAPPSASYKLRKFARKHRTALSTAVALATLLIVGAAISTWQAVRATRAESVARDAEVKARRAQQAERKRAEGERQQKLRAEAGEKLAGQRLKQVESARKKAEEEKQIAQAVREFLQNKLLGQADVREQADSLLRAGAMASEAKENPTIRELLDRAARELTPIRIEANFPQPRIQAEILCTVGLAFCGVGEYERAIVLLERAVVLLRQHNGPEVDDTLASMCNLAAAYHLAGKRDQALPLLGEALDLCRTRFGSRHPATLIVMGNLAMACRDAGQLDLALRLFEELRAAQPASGSENRNTLRLMGNLARLYQDDGRLDVALPLYEETLERQKASLGSDHPDTVVSMSNLAGGLLANGQSSQALSLFQESLPLMQAKLGPDHPETLSCMSRLANAYIAVGEFDRSTAIFEECLEISKAKLGARHPDTIKRMNELADAHRAAGNFPIAIAQFEEALALCKQASPELPNALAIMHNLAVAYQAQENWEKAIPLFEETLALRKIRLSPNHPDTLATMNRLAVTYWSAKQYDMSVPLAETSLKGHRARFGPHHFRTLIAASNLGLNYVDVGRLDEGIALLEETLLPAKEYPSLEWVGASLLTGYAMAGQRDKAIALANELVVGARSKFQVDSVELAGYLASVGRALLQAKAFAEAAPLLRECMTIREKLEPDLWSTYNTKSMLGGALLGQEKYPEAEPLLLAGLEGMKQREQMIPEKSKSRLPESLDRLIEFYTATNNSGEAAKWQAERAKYSIATPTTESR